MEYSKQKDLDWNKIKAEKNNSSSGSRGLGFASQMPYLGKDEIAERARDLLEVCWDGSFPVDVEKICDYLGVAIIPVQGLREEFEVEAFLAADFKMIYVDLSGYEKESVRYRFSVAHELGHYILHQEYYPSGIGSFEEWKFLASNFDYVEFQANYFAASLLAPERELVGALDREFGGSFVRNCWNKSHGEFGDALKRVRKFFKVSEQVLARRMRDLMPGAEEFDEVAVGLRSKICA